MIYVNSVISYILGNFCYCTIKLHLILVLMEDALRTIAYKWVTSCTAVLILVLMEDTLREVCNKEDGFPMTGLNPCFNGRYSQSVVACRNSSGL